MKLHHLTPTALRHLRITSLFAPYTKLDLPLVPQARITIPCPPFDSLPSTVLRLQLRDGTPPATLGQGMIRADDIIKMQRRVLSLAMAPVADVCLLTHVTHQSRIG